MDTDRDQDANIPAKVLIGGSNLIPKICTNISFSAMQNGMIVMSMAYAEDKEQLILIERVLIDREHAKKIVSVLGNLLEATPNVPV